MGREEIDRVYQQSQEVRKEKPYMNVLSNIVLFLAVYGIIDILKNFYHLILSYYE